MSRVYEIVFVLIAIALFLLFVSGIVALGRLVVNSFRRKSEPQPHSIDPIGLQDHLSALERLAQLKAAGTLTETEFESEKQKMGVRPLDSQSQVVKHHTS